ncbi:hypothetical protein [Microvirga aerophila]|uniref:Uncharacterized protein n=1 Tax=Microvirga aerophila TaxID=670291 RepID=A0A512C3Y4_9HYPH|nr:hypothetical protein [Microvirga aerophila]GEO18926.1 hypothetical protein MAE02_66220 [Microvirga aerophila]
MLRLGVVIVATALTGAVFSQALGNRPMDAAVAAETSLTVFETAGYGIDSCLQESGECRMVVAHAWCETHGLPQVAAVRLSANRRDLTVSCTR